MSEASALSYYKKYMTGIEKFNYARLETNINKSVFALWGVYDAL